MSQTQRIHQIVHLLETSRHPVLIDGEKTFNAIFAAVDPARHCILVDYYILRDDRIGRELQRRPLTVSRCYCFTTVGTANFDNRSFRLDFEGTAAVADRDFTAGIARMLSPVP